MRLFDKFARAFIGHERFVSFPWSEVRVLAVDQVFSALRDELFVPDRIGHREKDYPFAMPPWEMTFVESNVDPSFRRLDVYGKMPKQVGCIVSSSRIGETYNLHGEERRVVEDGRVRAGFNCAYVLNLEEIVGFSECWGAFTVDERGDTSFASAMMNSSGEMPEWLANIFHCTLLSFTFANCCNVKCADVTEDLQPPEKIRRRLKLPEVKRYTLNIAGHVSRPSREYNQGPQGVMPFHLCRGHFATYTPEKPLFGNPKLVGRYWHPPHMRGKKENGEIVKDYAIQG